MPNEEISWEILDCCRDFYFFNSNCLTGYFCGKKKILLESPMRLLSGLSLLRIPTLSFPLGLLDRYFFQVKKKKKS